MLEKREYPGFQLKLNAKYSVMGYKDVFNLGRIQDISIQGICFESDKRLNVGTHVNLELELEDKMKHVSLTGIVKWSQEMEEGQLEKKKYVNGVKLIDLSESDEAMFLKYYCNMIAEKLSGYLTRRY